MKVSFFCCCEEESSALVFPSLCSEYQRNAIPISTKYTKFGSFKDRYTEPTNKNQEPTFRSNAFSQDYHLSWSDPIGSRDHPISKNLYTIPSPNHLSPSWLITTPKVASL